MDTLKAALAYAARGWLVIPLHNPEQGKCSCCKQDCSSPGKHPRVEHGLKEGSKVAGQITQWFTRWPDANLGILTEQAAASRKNATIDRSIKSGRLFSPLPTPGPILQSRINSAG